MEGGECTGACSQQQPCLHVRSPLLLFCRRLPLHHTLTTHRLLVKRPRRCIVILPALAALAAALLSLLGSHILLEVLGSHIQQGTRPAGHT